MRTHTHTHTHTHTRQDVQPMIEAIELEHAFMHILDDLSGHLHEFGEESPGGDVYQDDAELVSSKRFLHLYTMYMYMYMYMYVPVCSDRKRMAGVNIHTYNVPVLANQPCVFVCTLYICTGNGWWCIGKVHVKARELPH